MVAARAGRYTGRMTLTFEQLESLLREGGLAVVAVWATYAWWGERAERKAAQAQVMELATSSVAAVLKSEAATESLKEYISRLEERRR
jgi:hypothetical protein